MLFLFPIYFLLHICIWFGATTGSDGLRNVRLDAPRYVRQGEDVNLSCQYDIDTRLLYAVKWYRGSDEFARYLPKEIPPQQVFPQRGIHVNVSITLSNEHQIRLTNMSRESSGIYKCVVSAETTFKTLSDDQDVSVIVVGYESPSLYIDQSDYNIGDTVHANCSVERTSHPVNISWFVNNKEIPKLRSKSFLIHDSISTEAITSISTFSFTLPEATTIVKLKCTGQLFDIYNMSSEMDIPFKPRRFSMMSTSPDTLTKRFNQTTRGSAQQLHHQQSIPQRFLELQLTILYLINYIILPITNHLLHNNVFSTNC